MATFSSNSPLFLKLSTITLPHFPLDDHAKNWNGVESGLYSFFFFDVPMHQRFRQRCARVFLAVLCLQSVSSLLPSPVSAAEPVLVVGEVSWAGSSRSTADEWIEVWNVGEQPVTLDGYHLLGAGGTDSGLTFPSGSVIQPHATFVIANYAASDTRSVLASAPDWVTTAVSLINDTLALRLEDPQGTLLDQVGDGSKPAAGSSGEQKASMVRQWPLEDGTSATAWKTADVRQGMDIEVPDLGTPGSCDACGSIPVPPPPETLPPAEDPVTVEEPLPIEELLPVETTSTIPLPQEEVVVPEAPGPQYPAVMMAITGELVAGQPILFDAASSSDPNGDILTFAWDMGDGTLETSAFLEHRYASSGTYLVTLGVSDGTFHSIATTSLEIAPPEEPEEVPETPETPEPVVTNVSPSSTTTTSQTVTATVNASAEVKLNEIHPAPLTGLEWIELKLVEGDAAALLNWELHDANGRIHTLDATLLASLVWTDGLSVLSIPRSVLNNGGDTVRLVRADGQLEDEVTYPSIAKGSSYARLPDDSAWQKTELATPGLRNPETEEAETIPTPAPTVTVTQTPPTQPVAVSSIHASSTSTVRAVPKANTTKTTVLSIKKPVATPAPKKVLVKKTSTASPAAAVINATFFDLPMLTSDARVRLSGTVGSVPGLLAKNVFILLSADGRGLYVTGNGKQPSPAFGSFIEVYGTLSVNDDGVRLRMLSKDTWIVKTSTEKPTARIVDLILPAQEDAWSLVEITATVGDVRSTKVELATEDVDLSATIKAVTHYRAVRLKKGDQIKITGILDTRSEPPTLLPRSADDIQIIGHASLATATDTPESRWPSWTPFGAAGLAVAVSEGVKRVQKIREQKRLEQMVAEAANHVQAMH